MFVPMSVYWYDVSGLTPAPPVAIGVKLVDAIGTRVPMRRLAGRPALTDSMYGMLLIFFPYAIRNARADDSTTRRSNSNSSSDSTATRRPGSWSARSCIGSDHSSSGKTPRSRNRFVLAFLAFGEIRQHDSDLQKMTTTSCVALKH